MPLSFRKLRAFWRSPPATKYPSLPKALSAWGPDARHQRPAVLLRWLVTEWCNYRCPYCPQTHDRRAEKGDGLTAHAFDNFPLETWLEAFDRHFKDYRLSLVITGGEPMVDRKNMPLLLDHFSAKESVECIRIDTNAWWKPEQFALKDISKIILMCTFHPSQTSEDEFMARIRRILDAGFRIGMINYVMHGADKDLFEDRRRRFRDIGVALHPNPLWGSNGTYPEADLAIMKSSLPEVDYLYRTGTQNPYGKGCLFPALSYEMDYKGHIHAGCMSEGGLFFDSELPKRPLEAVLCPMHSCVCLDKYSFLSGIERNISTNPLMEYKKALWDRHPERD
ncbi:MAG: radical SAM protein [Methylovirgula sp.]|nr:radical SAM protein [Methylovirgula sp.]